MPKLIPNHVGSMKTVGSILQSTLPMCYLLRVALGDKTVPMIDCGILAFNMACKFEPTKIISLKTQPQAVNACVKRSSQRSLSFGKISNNFLRITKRNCFRSQ